MNACQQFETGKIQGTPLGSRFIGLNIELNQLRMIITKTSFSFEQVYWNQLKTNICLRYDTHLFITLSYTGTNFLAQISSGIHRYCRILLFSIISYFKHFFIFHKMAGITFFSLKTACCEVISRKTSLKFSITYIQFYCFPFSFVQPTNCPFQLSAFPQQFFFLPKRIAKNAFSCF